MIIYKCNDMDFVKCWRREGGKEGKRERGKGGRAKGAGNRGKDRDLRK